MLNNTVQMNIKFFSVSLECTISWWWRVTYSFLPLQRQYHSQIDNLIEETVKEMITLLVAKVQNHTKCLCTYIFRSFTALHFMEKYFTLSYTDLVDSAFASFFFRHSCWIKMLILQNANFSGTLKTEFFRLMIQCSAAINWWVLQREIYWRIFSLGKGASNHSSAPRAWKSHKHTDLTLSTLHKLKQQIFTINTSTFKYLLPLVLPNFYQMFVTDCFSSLLFPSLWSY